MTEGIFSLFYLVVKPLMENSIMTLYVNCY